MAYTRGIVTTGAGSYGYVQSIDHTHNSEIMDIKDETGITRVHEHFDKKSAVEVSAKFGRSSTLPTVGGTVVLAATPSSSLVGAYYVDSVGVSEVNNDAATVKISLLRFVEAAIPTT